MTQFKTILMTAAILALPSVAFAQIPTGAVTDVVKDKAVETVMDNLTADDTITAGKTLLKGGSKEDAAIAVVKGRVDNKVEGLTGGTSVDDLSVDGALDAGKTMAVEKAQGSASTYTGGVTSASDLSTDGLLDAGKSMAVEKAKGSATSYTDKAAGSATSYTEPVMQKSQDIVPAAPTLAPISCPSGTKNAGDGTCMITGDFKY